MPMQPKIAARGFLCLPTTKLQRTRSFMLTKRSERNPVSDICRKLSLLVQVLGRNFAYSPCCKLF